MGLDGKGVTGRVHVDDTWVTITRKGVLAKANYGFTRGEKRILIASITSVQFKKPGLSNGYIQFSLAGGIESRRGVLDATKDENSVVFSSIHGRKFEQIRDFIEATIVERTTPPAAPAPTTTTGVADELAKLADLRDQGVLSNEEFQAQKARLLADTPTAPKAPPGPVGQPQWLPDPTNRHDRRFWDGTSWTSQAISGRQPVDDPI